MLLLRLPKLTRLQNDPQHSGLVCLLVGPLEGLHRAPSARSGHISCRQVLPLGRALSTVRVPERAPLRSTSAFFSAFLSQASARCREIGLVGSGSPRLQVAARFAAGNCYATAAKRKRTTLASLYRYADLDRRLVETDTRITQSIIVNLGPPWKYCEG